jgi:hypothetical protein
LTAFKCIAVSITRICYQLTRFLSQILWVWLLFSDIKSVAFSTLIR